jgi:hypothetical protein
MKICEAPPIPDTVENTYSLTNTRYFILWLRDYKDRYNKWDLQSKTRNGVRPGEFHLAWPAQSSSQLALFYVRAKQTFFTPGSDYELNVP